MLGELDLGNNPCAFAEEYRHLLSLSFPQLTKLDGEKKISSAAQKQLDKWMALAKKGAK